MDFRRGVSVITQLHILARHLNFVFEPRCEKTGLGGFRLGHTQTRLCSHRICLEARNLVYRK